MFRVAFQHGSLGFLYLAHMQMSVLPFNNVHSVSLCCVLAVSPAGSPRQRYRQHCRELTWGVVMSSCLSACHPISFKLGWLVRQNLTRAALPECHPGIIYWSCKYCRWLLHFWWLWPFRLLDFVSSNWLWHQAGVFCTALGVLTQV